MCKLGKLETIVVGVGFVFNVSLEKFRDGRRRGGNSPYEVFRLNGPLLFSGCGLTDLKPLPGGACLGDGGGNEG
jgi:hypothetical protein